MKVLAKNMVRVLAMVILFTVIASVSYGSDVSRCVETILKQKKYRDTVCTTASARAGSPGAGSQKKDRKTACIAATKGYKIVGAAEVKLLECMDNRCKVSSVTYETDENGNPVKACATVEAYSESVMFGGGGKAKIQLCAVVEQDFPVDEMLKIVKECEGK